jgi:hypothetical protein
MHECVEDRLYPPVRVCAFQFRIERGSPTRSIQACSIRPASTFVIYVRTAKLNNSLSDYVFHLSFEMWCWRRMENISWTDHVRNKEVLLRVKEQRNILHEIRKRKANWIGHILRRNCLLQRVTEGKIQGGIEVTGRQGRRRRKLLDNLKERKGYSHLK